MYNKCLDSTYFGQSSNEYKLNSIILDIANCRIFQPVKPNFSNVSTDKFLKLEFANKGIDALNIGNILNQKEATKHIPAYVKYKTTPKISYTDIIYVASKLFNYKESIRDFNIHDHQLPTCSCSSSPYLYSPAGHVITGNLNIIDNLKLKDLIYKGPKYKSFNWKYNFKLVIDAVEDYAKRWNNDEEADLDSLSEWIKAIRRLLKRKNIM